MVRLGRGREMCTLCGQVVTIKEIYAKDQSYFIEEDNGWFWTDEMFEGLIKTTKQLGKIIFAEYGILKDYSKQIGLQLGFSFGCKIVRRQRRISTVFINYENDENIRPKKRDRFGEKCASDFERRKSELRIRTY